MLGCSKSRKIKVGNEAPAPLKGRAFRIEISKVSGSALVAEICTDPHNRLLRRQHCSSLCSQSEGHEHVANMYSALGHDFVGFLAVFGRVFKIQKNQVGGDCAKKALSAALRGLKAQQVQSPGQRPGYHVPIPYAL